MVELEQYHKSDSYKSFIEQREKTLKSKLNTQNILVNITKMFCDIFLYFIWLNCSSQARRESISK
jgi:hypothetical protein